LLSFHLDHHELHHKMKPHLDDEVSLGSGLLSRNPQSAKSDKAQLEYFFLSTQEHRGMM